MPFYPGCCVCVAFVISSLRHHRWQEVKPRPTTQPPLPRFGNEMSISLLFLFCFFSCFFFVFSFGFSFFLFYSPTHQRAYFIKPLPNPRHCTVHVQRVLRALRKLRANPATRLLCPRALMIMMVLITGLLNSTLTAPLSPSKFKFYFFRKNTCFGYRWEQ
jgi:hypothetical protein